MASNSKLVDFKFPVRELERAIKRELKVKLNAIKDIMKQKARANIGVYPVPERWIQNVQHYIKVEDKGSGNGIIHMGVGLSDDTPEQALWQAYILNFGSGEFGKASRKIYSRDRYYDVEYGYENSGSGDGLYYYPQFSKHPQDSPWFSDTVDMYLGGGNFEKMLDDIVENAFHDLFESGRWKLEGNKCNLEIKI